MIDQLIVGDKYSYDDFGASVCNRKIGYPEKKSIKDTVPFSNQTYDFSKINGELYWEERELEYVFEIIAPTPEDLEDAKIRFANWIMNAFEENIIDPFIPDYHFKGSFSEIDTEDDEGMDKTTITVRFTAYPYKIANYPKQYTAKITANGTTNVAVSNEAAHRVTPIINTDQEILIVIGTSSYAIPAGQTEDATLNFDIGVTQLNIQSVNKTPCTVTISFYEEVL